LHFLYCIVLYAGYLGLLGGSRGVAAAESQRVWRSAHCVAPRHTLLTVRVLKGSCSAAAAALRRADSAVLLCHWQWYVNVPRGARWSESRRRRLSPEMPAQSVAPRHTVTVAHTGVPGLGELPVVWRTQLATARAWRGRGPAQTNDDAREGARAPAACHAPTAAPCPG